MSARPALDAAGLPLGYHFKPEYEVTARQAREMLDRGAAVLIDVRNRDEWDRAKIEGAVLIPLGELESRLDEIAALSGARGGAPIVAHCHLGGRSMKAALFLRQRGFDDAKSMAGGIDAWSLGVDANVPRYERTVTGAIRVIP